MASRNPWGVWKRHSDARGGMLATRPSSTMTMVSEEGTPTATASCVSSAASTRSITGASTNGRAASWKSTRVSPGCPASAPSAATVDPVRVSPPSITPVTLENGAARAAAVGTCPGVITTSTSPIPGCASKAAIACARIGRPPTSMSCLGTGEPTRCPTPPARTTATVCAAMSPHLVA